MLQRVLPVVGLAVVLLSGCGGSSSDRAVDAPPATNDDGNPTTAIIKPIFNPSGGELPFPTSLLMSGTTDLTINPPVADPSDFSDPSVVLSSLDGFSTTNPWVANFSDPVKADTVVTGSTVRFFQVTTSPQGATTGVVRELAPGTEYVASMVSETTLAVIPLQPLQELTSYLVVLTNGITDPAGNAATPDDTYFIAQRTEPLLDANGQSTLALLDDATAAALEPLRQLTNSQEFAVAAAGVNKADIVLSWTATTQGITPVLGAVRSTTQPGVSELIPTGMTTVVVGGAGLADLYMGTLTLPYYLDAPTAENPLGPITGFWEAMPGAYVPPFDSFGLDPSSTTITYANPFPVVKSMQTIPVLMSVPNAASGQSMPETGWPVVIFQHGITRHRGDMLAIADTLAAQGFIVVAIDQPLHGVMPDEDLAPILYVDYIPFVVGATERTFDVDYIDNATSAPGSDGIVDSSGAHTINLASLLTSRDNLRQATADLWVLAATIPEMDLDADGIPDLDGSRISFVGQSLGAMVGTAFLAFEPTVSVGVLSVPGGGIARMLEASVTFGPRIVGGLAAAGVVQGSDDYNSFLTVTQTALDSADPINHAMNAAMTNAILMHEVVGGPDSLPDQVIPNAVATAPLSGTEPLIRQMQLASITATLSDAAGVRAVSRFSSGDHGSLLSPAASLATTVEMQRQMSSMLATMGTTVLVNDPTVLAGQ